MAQEQTDEYEFSDILKEFAHGSTNRVATERLREIVKACRETGSKGAITIKFSIDVKAGIVEMKAGISVKKPEPSLPGQCFYATDAGDLVDEDPRQLKLPTKVIDAPSATVKIVRGGEGGAQ